MKESKEKRKKKEGMPDDYECWRKMRERRIAVQSGLSRVSNNVIREDFTEKTVLK